MANGDQTSDDPEPGESPAGEGGGPGCMACRGTGRVISGLGGTPHEVVCPWCRGTGERIRGIDAQQHPSEAGRATDA